jgi:putative phosphonate metabolism protein
MRYAIYFTPPADDPLTRRASHWLGRDAFSGETLAQPIVEAFSEAAFSEMTFDPRRYGFHATMKAPFELADGVSEAELVDAFESFAARQMAFTLPSLVLGQLGHFFALVPGSTSPELQKRASDCVTVFDRFRAPLDDADISRRKPERLTANERRNLMAWGYPYVLDDFRFHMTVTGPVEREDQSAMRAAIEGHFAGLLDQPREIDTLSLFIEPSRGSPFVMHHMVPLAGNATRKTA